MTKLSAPHAAPRGFSLLEITLAIGISGILMGSIWQLMGITAQQREAASVASQAYAVAQAGQSYLNANATTLLALPGLAGINDVVRLKVTAADTGANATNVQDSGYLPASFVNFNSYGQSYAFYAQRQEGGAAGPDAADQLIGLVITTGGSMIGDQLGARAASSIGAAGGFMYQDSNPTPPTAATTAKGTAGGWTLNLSGAGWTSSVGATANAGHLAVLTTLMAGSSGMGGGAGGGGGASSIDGLSDGKTDYASDLNLFLGTHSGDAISSGGQNNTSTGIYALQNLGTGDDNTAFGIQALQGATTGGNNTAFGYNAGANVTTGSGNIMIGSSTLATNAASSNQLNIGNTLYGDLATKQLNLGNATLTAAIGFDAGSNTSASRLSVGNNAQRPACDGSLEGAQRYNWQSQTQELCVGGAWMQPSPAWTPTGFTPPTPPTGSGFIILTNDEWDGNLGGIAGARAKCLSDLSSHNWMGKAAAVAAGQLVISKIDPMLYNPIYDSGSHMSEQFHPPVDAQYFFAASGRPAVGGGSMTITSPGAPYLCWPNHWPCNLPGFTWSGANYFDGTFRYWTARTGNGADAYNTCSSWTTNSSGSYGRAGISSDGEDGRTTSANMTCDLPQRLVCLVNP